MSLVRSGRGSAIALALLACAPLACTREEAPRPGDWRCLHAKPPAERARPAGEFAFVGWQPPRHREQRLVEATGRSEGPVAADAGLLGELAGEAFASQPLGAASGVRLIGPVFDPPLTGVARLRIRLRPGGAKVVRVIPFGTGMDEARMQRSHRAIELALERDAAPDQAVDLVVDVTEALRGNWSDAAAGSALHHVELELPGAEAARTHLEGVWIEDERAHFAGAAAGRRDVDRDGVVRPSWFVNDGARARIPVEPGAGAAELRWHEATLGDGARTAIRVVANGVATALPSGDPAPGWQARRASLAAWSGQRVELELAAEGGTAIFGDPRVVEAQPSSDTPDVLLYLVDTLRADGVGAFGSPRRGVTPVLDRLAREGLVFARAHSTSSWTKPAIPTLMTGLHPAAHGVGATSYTDRLPAEVPVIQGAFRAAGWRAGSFAANPLGSTLSGLERGFGAAFTPRHWHGAIGDLGHPEASQLHAALLAWLDQEPDLPFFAYVHTLEPHEWEDARYAADPPSGWDAYDAATHDADRQLGALLEELALRERRLLLVVASDHGESLGEHGVKNHGTTLYQGELHVPLLFWAGDALPPMTVTAPVSLEDVAPTLLDLLGLLALPDASGRSLAAWARDGGAPAAAAAGVSSELGRYVWTPTAPHGNAFVSSGLEKRIAIDGAPARGFDLASDPCELRSLPELARRLETEQQARMASEAAARERFVHRYGEGTRGPVDAGEVERLRALGYVE